MGALSYVRSVVDRNVFMRRMPVVALYFEWECKRFKTESTWKFFPFELKQGGVGGGGGEGFEFVVNVTVKIF